MTRERMSSVDTAWLRMDCASNLMMIVGIDVFETPVSIDALRRMLSERLLRFDRFRQRVEIDPTGAWWVDDERFDLDHHLKTARLPGDGSDVQMQRFVARLAAQPLDRGHPLWQFHLVDNYKGTNALVVRIHHCIADGIALIGVLLSLTDDAPDAPADEDDDDPPTPNPYAAYLKPVTQAVVRAIETGGAAWSKSMEVLLEPDRLTGYAQVGARVLQDALRIATMPNDSSTSLKGKPGTAKAIAWNQPLPLSEVKMVAKALDASVNDVLLSCVAGAIRRYLIGNGEDVDGCEVRAMVPVNLRPAGRTGELGNRFGLVPLALPVGIANPLARLREVHRRMDELKGGYQAMLAFALLGVVGNTPKRVQSEVLDMLARKATAVMTNVPGPSQPILMAGARLSRMMFWVPSSGDIGMGVSILSYAGGVQFGVITDTTLCPKPQRIIDGFEPEFERLVLLLAMLPPSVAADPLADELEMLGRLFPDAATPVRAAARADG